MNDKCQYKLSKVLGEGAYGKVYLVRNKQEKTLAYKTLTPSKKTKTFKVKNPLELDIMFRLKSPHLLRGEDITLPGECSNEFGIISEYLPGDTDIDIYYMDLNQRKSVMFDLSNAIKCLHDNDYLHLDVKLNNTRYVVENHNIQGKKDKKESFKNKNIRTILIDYGTCSYTPYGVNVGIMTYTPRFTYDYTAPEGCIADDYDMFHYTNKSDIWALGITFLEIIAGGTFDFIPDELLDLYEEGESEESFTEFSEFLKYYFSKERIDEFMEYYAFHYAPKNLSTEDKNLLKDLIKNMLKIDPQERYDINQILNHPYFKNYENPFTIQENSCKLEKPENISLLDVDNKDLRRVFNIISICKKYFKDDSSYIFFMAIDVYLRVISKIGYIENLEMLSILISHKYFNWSEYSSNKYAKNLEKLLDQENMIYKILKGKIRSERYFINCENIEEVKFVYKYFIKPDYSSGEIDINPNLVNYLNYDGYDFMKSRRIKSNKIETLEKIKELTEVLSVDATKFYKGNKSAGTRARKTAQELKALLQKLRGEILEHKKTDADA